MTRHGWGLRRGGAVWYSCATGVRRGEAMTHVFDRPVVLETHLEALGPKRRGKVRDIYDLGEYLLLVATDRLSAFDVVLPDGILGKGYVLTQLSKFWFEWL